MSTIVNPYRVQNNVLTVILFIPLCKLPQTFSQRNLGREADFSFEGSLCTRLAPIKPALPVTRMLRIVFLFSNSIIQL